MLLVAALSWACGRTAAPAPLAWQAAVPGFDYVHTTVRPAPAQGEVDVHFVRFEPSRFALQVVLAPVDLHRPLADAAAFRRAVAGLAAINGGYFDPQFHALGLLVSQGKQLSPLRHVDHGVFFVAGNSAGVRHAREWRPPQDLEFAVECGPRLLVDGRPLTFKPGAARRVAIGVDAAGRIVLAVTEGVLTLAEFADLLARPVAHGGPALVSALNLDGGSSTMLDVAAGLVQAAVRSAVEVPVGLAVVPRLAIAGPPVPALP